MRHRHSTLEKASALLLLIAIVSLISVATAAVDFQIDGKLETASTVQLWYEGLWKNVRQADGKQYSGAPVPATQKNALRFAPSTSTF